MHVIFLKHFAEMRQRKPSFSFLSSKTGFESRKDCENGIETSCAPHVSDGSFTSGSSRITEKCFRPRVLVAKAFVFANHFANKFGA